MRTTGIRPVAGRQFSHLDIMLSSEPAGYPRGGLGPDGPHDLPPGSSVSSSTPRPQSERSSEPPFAGDRTGTDVSSVRSTYDRVADEYARRIFNELDGKPLDRQILERFADRVRGAGLVYDLGCGPGHVTRFLHDRGVDITGVDISDAMVRNASQLNPGIEFRRGDLRAIESDSKSAAGLVSFYSIIHLDPVSLDAAFSEWHRVLAKHAPLLLAFHVGAESIHLDEWWGHDVDIDFVFFESAAVLARLREAGFDIIEAIERDPYPDVEHPSRRACVLAEAT
jgi:SAM-dependent methyltransferase